MMTIVELATLVAEMRAAQKEYFRTKSHAALDRAIRLEAKVDEACKQVQEQPVLFD